MSFIHWEIRLHFKSKVIIQLNVKLKDFSQKPEHLLKQNLYYTKKPIYNYIEITLKHY